MKIITQVTTVILMSFLMVSCSNGQTETKDGSIADDVNVEQFVSKMEGAQLLDVRTPAEWDEGIIEGAIMADFYNDDFKSQLEKLNKDVPVAVYCRSGGRSGNAMDMMNEMGFKEVYNLDGGIGAWNDAEKPIVKP